MKSDRYDYMIVGAGLAGTTLALQLHKLGKKILIFDSKEANTSSNVAAGLFNPITGRKMVKTWKADMLFPFLTAWYPSIEKTVNANFLYYKTIYRPFFEQQEQNEWMGKSADDQFHTYIKKVSMQSFSSEAKDPFGGLALDQCGFLDIPSYLNNALQLISKHHLVIKEDFAYEKINIQKEGVNYEDYRASKLIFCEGTGLLKNPFFNWLPLRPVKGEILLVRLSEKLDYILNRGVFVLPVGKGMYKIGSTYDHQDLSLRPTEKGKNQLIRKVGEILNAEVEVIDHFVGLRPATKDRRPFVGIHPAFETIGVFNGLGTKGVSLAPYWAHQFVDYLENGKKLDGDVNITRHFSLYSESREIDE